MTCGFWISRAADGILVLHFTFVAFVVLGLPAIWVGHVRGWQFVTSWRFRLVHLGAMAFVLVQSFVGRLCPLTLWEHRLRVLAGQQGYDTTFMQYWLHRVLFIDLSPATFIVFYTAFFALLGLTMWLCPVRRRDTSRVGPGVP